MAGFINNGVPQAYAATGSELINADTQNTQGQNPESESMTLNTLAMAISFLIDTLAAGKTMVAGTRYYTSFTLGQSGLYKGAQVKIGGTGGTDRWLMEVRNTAGVLIATSDTATGITAGTAATWQQFPFGVTGSETPVQIPAGNYFVSLQSNGTTATFATINSPTSVLITGSTTGTFGVAATPTMPTTYTANVGPRAFLYQ